MENPKSNETAASPAPGLPTGEDSVHEMVRGILADIAMAKTWSSDYLAADRGYGHGWRPVSYRLAVELEKCRASLGAIQECEILCDFINKEMRMTAADPRVAELAERISALSNRRDEGSPAMKKPRHGLPPCDHDECPPTRCVRLAGDSLPSPCSTIPDEDIPLSTGKTRNHARELLGEVLRHKQGLGSHGCVESVNATEIVIRG